MTELNNRDNKVSSTVPKKKALSSMLIKMLLTALGMFILIQLLSVNQNITYLNQYIDSIVKESEEEYKRFSNFQKALKIDNQEEIIYQFSKVHNKSDISDLLLTTLILNRLYSEKEGSHEDYVKKYPKEAEEERIKWTNETRNFIVDTYLKSPKAGVNKSRDALTKISCNKIDLSCELIKSYFAKQYANSVEAVEHKIDVGLYNIEHIDECRDWFNRRVKQLANNANNTTPLSVENKSPGEIAMNKTK